MADSLSRQPDVAGSPKSDDFSEESCSGPYALYDSVVYGAFEDWLNVTAPHLALADCVQAMKGSLDWSY